LENRQYEKAVELFVTSGQPRKALELCLQHNIAISEEMAEAMSGDEDSNGKANPDLLNEVASVCYRQGNYHLATKKWTQAGNRLQAMKSLLKSGDTERVIFFANVSRDADIYILAGNYLQTLDWRNNADIMKSIITFYQKAKAYELLGWFYQACAEVEIDEYQNYEKALGALTECLKCLERALPQNPKLEERVESVRRGASLISRFAASQRDYADGDRERAVRACEDLLKVEDVNASVRRGDVYGFLIEHHASAGNFRAAKGLVDELKAAIPNVNLAYYVNTDALAAIERGAGVQLRPREAAGGVDTGGEENNGL